MLRERTKRQNAAKSTNGKEQGTRLVPAFASDALHNDVHDVDTKVEIGLLLDEGT